MVTTLSAARTAQLYLRHIWKHHGLPKKVVSDRGLQFVAEFMKELYRLLGIKLSATTAYHPQGDGQTEQVNQELEQFLHLATQNVPFLLNTGWIPQMGFEPGQWKSHLETVNEFKEWMEGALEEGKAALAKSKDDMAK